MTRVEYPIYGDACLQEATFDLNELRPNTRIFMQTWTRCLMEITVRGFWTLVHGMGFGALYLLAFSGLVVELVRRTNSSAVLETSRRERFFKGYLITMVMLAWAAVLTGTYVVYPWYRASPPVEPTTALSAFPQRLLLSNATTSKWHSFGMEWKEHIAWFTPISMTVVAFVFIRYGRELRQHKQLRDSVLCFALISFLAAIVAGFFGAMTNKYAPVQGGSVVRLSDGNMQ